MTSTLTAPVALGRHRLGIPGLVSVTAFVKVARRGLFASWRRPGKHRVILAPRRLTGTPSPAHAV